MEQETKAAPAECGRTTIDRLQAIMTDRPLTCRFLWTLFTAAATASKRDFLLRPFPTRFQSDGVKDFDRLNRAIDAVTSLHPSVLQHASDEQLYLFSFVFLVGPSQLRALSAQELQGLFTAGSRSKRTLLPNAAFEVLPDEEHRTHFESVRGAKKLLRAYHGSRLDHFYSILRNGLCSNLNKTSAFGEGTYLSTELNVSLLWSPFSAVSSSTADLPWSTLSCVALCQVAVGDGAGVKVGCRVDDRRYLRDKNYMSAVPESYIIVQNNELVRITHLLLYYTSKAPRCLQLSSAPWNRVAHWLQNNVFWSLVLVYAAMLFLVAVVKTPHIGRYIYKISGLLLDD